MGRYKVMTGEFADLMLGYYGETIWLEETRKCELATKQVEEDADYLPSGRPDSAGVDATARQALP
jgi:methylmalonyl-CoA carboxyltransferase 5S subunit